MKQNLFNKLWLRVGMIVAIMTTALSGTVKADSYTITFATGSGDGTNGSTSTPCSTVVSDGASYLDGNLATAIRVYYAGGSGLKLGASSSAGEIKMNLAANVKATTIVVNAKLYNSSKTATIAANGKTAQSMTGSFADYTFTINDEISYIQLNSSKYCWIKSVTVNFASASTVATPTFSPEAGTYTSPQNVTISTETSGATIYYTTNGDDPTTNSTPYDGPISVSSTTTIKAIAAKANMTTSDVATATYTILDHAGTQADPYTVADARAAIDAGAGVTNVYATGIVSEIVTAYNSTYSNVTFDIIDEGSNTTLRAYRCGGAGADEVRVNDVVVVSGNLIKYNNSTYEFAEGCTLVSLTHPTIPTITVNPASLAAFTYEVGNGPSDAKTFTVSGANLTANLTLSLGNNSDFEMSTTEASGYTNSLTLTQSSGTVDETTVYVRMKSDLAVGNYNGTITLTSTGATTVEVSLSGSVTAPEALHVTWNLTTNDYDSSAEDLVSWTSSQATMTLAKGESSTKANNYLGGDNNYTHTRFYQNQVLTIAPASGYQILSAEITAVSSYVAGFTGNDWTNATTSTSGTTVTVTPTDGTQEMSVTISAACRATAVTVYYATNSTPILSVDPTTAEPFTYEVGDGPSDYQMFEVTGINLTDDITVSVTGEYELSDGNPYTSSLTLSSGDIFMVQLKEGLEIGSYDGEITISSPGATSLTIALSGTVTAVIPATIIPDITAVNVGSAEGDGTIDLTYTKVDESSAEVRFFDADGNSVEDSYYSWIAAEIDANNNIYFTVGANNTGAARTAYLKVYGQDDNGGDVFSELITITQSKYQPTGTLSNANIVAAGTQKEGYSDWTVTDGKGKKWFSHAIKNQHSNATSGYHFLQIKKNDNSGPYYIQVPDYGRKITSLKMTVSATNKPMTDGGNNTTLFFSSSNTTSETGIGVASGSGASSVTIDCSSLNLNTGYITAGGAVRIWDVDVTYEPLKLNSYGYATYASTNALDFTNADGFTAWQITGVSGDAINFSQITGAVDAGTGVLLMGTGGAEVTIINAESGETLTGNKLEGVTESKSINANEYYGLSGQSFVKVNAGTVPAGKALLPASEVSAGVKAFTFVFDDDATGISLMEDGRSQMEDGAIYNVAGQRINKMQKGINIVNGKKILY